MAFDVRRIDLGKLNSMTKYPSILTYHALGDKGALQDTVQVSFAGRVVGTEKVDGTNARLVFCPGGSASAGRLTTTRRSSSAPPGAAAAGARASAPGRAIKMMNGSVHDWKFTTIRK